MVAPTSLCRHGARADERADGVLAAPARTPAGYPSAAGLLCRGQVHARAPAPPCPRRPFSPGWHRASRTRPLRSPRRRNDRVQGVLFGMLGVPLGVGHVVLCFLAIDVLADRGEVLLPPLLHAGPSLRENPPGLRRPSRAAPRLVPETMRGLPTRPFRDPPWPHRARILDAWPERRIPEVSLGVDACGGSSTGSTRPSTPRSPKRRLRHWTVPFATCRVQLTTPSCGSRAPRCCHVPEEHAGGVLRRTAWHPLPSPRALSTYCSSPSCDGAAPIGPRTEFRLAAP